MIIRWFRYVQDRPSGVFAWRTRSPWAQASTDPAYTMEIFVMLLEDIFVVCIITAHRLKDE